MRPFEENNLKDTPLLRQAYARLEKSVEADIKADLSRILGQFSKQVSFRKYTIQNDTKLSETQKNEKIKQLELSFQKGVDEEKIHARRANEQSAEADISAARVLLMSKTGYDEIAAVSLLLISTGRTPMDFMDIKKQFGNDVYQCLVEYNEVAKYPEKFITHVQGFSPYTKLILTGDFINKQTRNLAQLTKLKADQRMVLELSDIQDVFARLKLLTGLSDRTDKALAAAFNKYFDTGFGAGVRIVFNGHKPVLEFDGPKKEIYVFAPSAKGPSAANHVTISPDGKINGGKDIF